MIAYAFLQLTKKIVFRTNTSKIYKILKNIELRNLGEPSECLYYATFICVENKECNPFSYVTSNDFY